MRFRQGLYFEEFSSNFNWKITMNITKILQITIIPLNTPSKQTCEHVKLGIIMQNYM